MRLLVNITSLYGHMTGIGCYTANLVRGLLRHPAVEEVRGVGLAGIWSGERLAARLRAGADARPVRNGERTGAWMHRARRLATRIPNMVPLIHTAQGWQLRAFGPGKDFLYWEPAYVPLPHRGPSVVTVHDLSHLRHPEYHPPERVAWLEKHLPASLARADRIVVVSPFTQRELLAAFPLDESRIHVVPPGVGPAFRPFSPAGAEAVLRRHGLEWKRYLLSVGTLEPRKNLPGLMRAYRSLPRRLRHRYPLVLAGARGWMEGETERLARRLEAAGQLRWLGYVPAADLPCLYAGALLMGYVSFYEGFGMPVVEAMACGTPVLVSDRGALPETAGGAAVQANPGDVEGLAERLESLIGDPEARARLGRLGPARARNFTWERSVARIIDCFESIGKTPSPPA